ncbi:vacuolar ATP synthase subunit S1-domain-containing protein [Kalaharituber pfeilii]|nr:vacuolar ATP synthase subunit S1-domain-containing protein [Kalaharituber pfeilii]
MRSPSATALLAAAAAVFLQIPSTVHGFANTSPFFLISTSEFSTAGLQNASKSVLTTTQFLEIAKELIAKCTSDAYVIARQPGIHASDFNRRHGGVMSGTAGMPHMKRALLGEYGESKSQLVVPYGKKDASSATDIADELKEFAKDRCGAEVVEVDPSSMSSSFLSFYSTGIDADWTGTPLTVGAEAGAFERFGNMKPKAVVVSFQEPDQDPKQRTKDLADTDAFLFSILESLATNKYTLIYTSTPRPLVDNLPFQSQHLQDPTTPSDELRRRSFAARDDKPDEPPSLDKASLFQRYAFFTPGIFMGYLAAFFVVMIAYVGLTALLSLKVSYGAFEKEMGPAAAKKQQQ